MLINVVRCSFCLNIDTPFRFEVDFDEEILQRVNGKESSSKTKVYADFMIEKLESGKIEYDAIWAEFELMLSASIETVSHTASYGFLLLAKYPAAQQRIYDELGIMHIFCNSEYVETLQMFLLTACFVAEHVQQRY